MSSVINETLLAIKSAFEAGVNIFNGGTAVSSSNPLPTSNMPRLSATTESYDGKLWESPIITKTGVAAEYSAICIFNPVGTLSKATLVALSAWVGSATQVRSIKTIVDPATLPAVWTERTDVFAKTLGETGASTCPYKAYTADLASLDPATWYNTNVTATTPIGSSVLGATKFLDEGVGIIIVCVTANITLNMYSIIGEEA